jgi:hypothetical protein
MKDPLTGEEFEPKLSSQKFANAKNRIAYNNMKQNAFRKEKTVLDKPLANNFKILKHLMIDKDEHRVHSQFLLGMGFDFKAFNGVEKHNEKNGYCVYCFILIHDDQHTKIIRHDRL